MKILMATMGLDIGGAETHIVELAKELKAEGHDIAIASNGGVYVPEIKAAGIRHYPVPMHRRDLNCMRRARSMLKKIIRQEQPDVVHAHARIPAFLCGSLQPSMKFPFVTTAHWVFETRGMLRYLTNWGQRTVAVSEDIKAYLMREYGVPEGHITVTVNGTLYVLGGYTMAPADDTAEPKKAAGATVVNGMFLTDDSSEYVGTIVGAYFDYAYNFDRKDVTVEAVAPLASVPAIVDDVMSAEIVLNGDMTLGTIDFSAYAGEDELTIVVADSVTFENLTLGSVVLSTVGADSVSGTVTLANGTVVLDNVNGIIAQNVTDPVEETVTSEIDGTVYAYDDAETEAVEKGSVSATGEIVSSIGTVENVAFDVPAGATVTAEAGIFYGAVTVEGDLVISGTAISFQSLSVTGTVTAEDDNSATAVKLYIGVTAEDMAMAGTGSVDGVTLAKTPGSVAYVSPNATVGEVFADLNSTAYYVEDALYLTAYAANADVAINDVQFKVDDARFDGWMYTDKDDKAQEVTGAMNVGEPAEVYSDIEYNIYNVTITADAGIGSVAVDGNVLANAGGNQFHINGLAAGQHTISYTLKSGYQGEATLTVKGENATVSGLDFTLSGNPEGTAQTVSVELSLAGTEPGQTTVVVDGGESGMGLTDYLLIILVVLIVVMAIIVALRMMRS